MHTAVNTNGNTHTGKDASRIPGRTHPHWLSRMVFVPAGWPFLAFTGARTVRPSHVNVRAGTLIWELRVLLDITSRMLGRACSCAREGVSGAAD